MRGESMAPDEPEARELADRIQTLAASIHAAEAELNRLLGEFDARDGWCGAGIRSIGHWLTLRCAFTRAEADRRASLVERRSDLPDLYGAFDEGRISVGYLQSAVRVAEPSTDTEIAHVATIATHPQAVRTFGAYRRAAEAADERARRRHGGAGGSGGAQPDPAEQANSPGADDAEGYDPTDPGIWLHTWWDECQHLRVDARLDATDGATLRALLEQIRFHDTPTSPGHEGAEGHPDEAPHNRRLTRSEAFSDLLRLAGDALAAAGVRNRWIDRFAITVTIDAETLAGIRPGGGTLADGTLIDAEQVCRWIEAATLEPLLMAGGKPLFLGRDARIASKPQRRALRVRDNGCGYPGCGRHDHLHAHHIIEWDDDGVTNVDVMVLLCGRHHRLLHRGEYRISVRDGLPVFDSPVLDDLRNRPPPEPLRTPQVDRATWRGCEPLTFYALDVLVGSLLWARREGADPEVSQLLSA